MIFSSNKVKNAVSVILGTGLLLSCSENNTPAVKGTNNATFYVDSVTAPSSFVVVGEANAQGKYNKKLLSLEACLKDNAQTNSVSNLKFDIVAGDVTMEKSTDLRGCIQWQELVEYDPDDEVKNVMMNRSIVAKESHSGAEKVMYTVNPIKSEFQYIRNGTYTDAVSGNPVSFKLQQFMMGGGQVEKQENQVIYVKIERRLENKSSSRMSRQTEIETLNLESKGVDFYNLKIDQQLNIVFPYRYYTRFSISLLKQNLDGIASEAIKKGNFKFYLVVLKENSDLNKPKVEDVLGGTQFTASPRGDAGLITVPVTLSFSNVTSITNRVNFLFTVVSTDSPALFVDQTFEGFSNGLVANKDLPIKLIPNGSSALPLYEGFVKQKADADAAKAPIAESLAKAGMQVIGNPFVKYAVKEGPALVAATKYVDLRKVMDNLTEAQTLTFDEKRAVCSAYYQAKITSDADLDYQNCLLNPAQQLEASVSEIVESVEPNVSSAPSVMDVETLNMTSSFEISNVNDNSNGNNVDGSIEGKANFGYGFPKLIEKITKWLTGIKAELEVSTSLSGKAYVSHKSENKQVDVNSGKITKEKEVTSLPIVISMNAKTTKCLVIVKRAATQTAFNRYYCTDVRQVTRTEYYYLVDYTRVDKTNSVIDIYSSVVNPFHMLVRGKDTYTSLKETLTSKGSITTFFLSKIDEKQLEDPSNYMTQSAPLVLSSRKNLLSK